MGNLQGPEEGGRNSLSTIIFNHLVVYIIKAQLPGAACLPHTIPIGFRFPWKSSEDISASSHVDPDVRLNALTAGKKAATARSS